MTPVRIHLDARLPYADGICFDDTHRLDRETIAMLRGRGLVWLTRLRIDNEGEEYRYPTGYVIAASLERAQEITDARGLGETVLGNWDCEVTR